MELFIDTANLQEIEAALRRGFVRGITTNPALLAKEPKTEFKYHIAKIVELAKALQPGVHLSVEVFSRDPREILAQAEDFVRTFQYPDLSIKIQTGYDELGVIRELAKRGISVNCTCNMSVAQAVMAAAAGSKFVSLFWGRIRDFGDARYEEVRRGMLERGEMEPRDTDPVSVFSRTRTVFDQYYPGVKIIAGSMRSTNDVLNAGAAGAHIVTVPPKFFPVMSGHVKTDEVVNEFLTKFAEWLA